MRRLLWLFPLCVAGIACVPEVTTADSGVATVGPNGGIFVFDNVGVAINVPKGALETESRIEVTVIDQGIPEVPNRKRISFGYRFSPSTLTFKAPITVFLPWQADRVPKAVDPGTFDMRRQTSSDPYLALSGVGVHADLTTVEAQTERLGLFWLTSPSQPNVAQLILDPTEATIRTGESQPFTAMVQDPTGSTLDVNIAWSCVPARVCDLDGGFFTAKAPGWAFITAKAGTMSETAQVKVQGDAVGPTTFVHENPFPTGNDLWGGTVLPGGLGQVFVGANGTVLTRDMAGQFTRVYSSPGVTLKAVGGTTPQNAVAVGTLGTAGVLVELTNGVPALKTFTTIDPRALWFDGTNGMAVGYGNDVLVRRAGVWVTEYSPSIETLLSVIGDGAGGFVTLGSRGSIYQYDPVTKTWNSLYQTQLSVLLTAGVLVSANGQEAWAASLNKVWHFTGGGWSSVNMPASPTISEVTTIGLVDSKIVLGAKTSKVGFAYVFDPAFMGGDAGVPPIPVDGGTSDGGASDGGEGDGGTDGGVIVAPPPPGWQVLVLRTPQIPRGFFGGGGSSTVGFLLGEAGAIYQYQGGALSELSRGFYGNVSAVSVVGTDVYAAVNECVDATCTGRLGNVYKRTGPGAFSLLGGSQPFGEPVFGMVAKANGSVMVSTSSAVYRYDGSSWSALGVGGSVAGPIMQFRFCGTTLYGVGIGGSFYRGAETNLARQPSVGGNDLFSVQCPSDTVVWVAGDTFLAERVGSGSWSPKTSMTVNAAPYRAIWSPGPGEAFAFGAARYGVYFNNVDLILVDTPGGIAPDLISGMWGSSIDNLYLVGSTTNPLPFGIALRFDGAEFRLIDSGSQRNVTSIDGSAPTEVWLGTETGGILRGVKP